MRKLLTITALLSVLFTAGAADVKVSALTPATTLYNTDIFYVVTNGVDRKVTLFYLRSNILYGLVLSPTNLPAGLSTSNYVGTFTGDGSGITNVTLAAIPFGNQFDTTGAQVYITNSAIMTNIVSKGSIIVQKTGETELANFWEWAFDNTDTNLTLVGPDTWGGAVHMEITRYGALFGTNYIANLSSELNGVTISNAAITVPGGLTVGTGASVLTLYNGADQVIAGFAASNWFGNALGMTNLQGSNVVGAVAIASNATNDGGGIALPNIWTAQLGSANLTNWSALVTSAKPGIWEAQVGSAALTNLAAGTGTGLTSLLTSAVTNSLPAILTNAINTSGNLVASGLTISTTGSVSILDFPTNTAVPSSTAPGTMRTYSISDNGFVQLENVTDLGIRNRLNQDVKRVFRNVQGAPITKGQAVYIFSGTGTRSNVKLAKADSLTTMPAVAIATATVADSAFGEFMIVGKLVDLKTDYATWTEGEDLYISADVAGALTNVAPSHPRFSQFMGIIDFASPTVGILSINLKDAQGNEDGTANLTFKVGTGTNLVSSSGSKINDVGITNGVVTATTVTATTLNLTTLNAGTLVVTNAPELNGISITNIQGSNVVGNVKTLGITIDGGGSAISASLTAPKGFIEVPCSGTILQATILTDQVGSIAISTWRTNSVNLTTLSRVGALFTNSITSTNWSRDATFTGASSLSLQNNDIIGFAVDSCSTITRATLVIKYQP